MLQNFIDTLKKEGLWFEYPIKDIPKSCCSSSMLVLDFDKIKDAFLKKFKIKGNVPKSADALLIDTINEVLFFIEMKDWKEWIVELKKGSISDFKTKIREKYLEIRVDQKIIDSYMLCANIADTCGMKHDFFPYLMNCKKVFLFLMGISSRDYVRLSISFLPSRYKYEYWKLGRAEFMVANNFERQIIDFMK